MVSELEKDALDIDESKSERALVVEICLLWLNNILLHRDASVGVAFLTAGSLAMHLEKGGTLTEWVGLLDPKALRQLRDCIHDRIGSVRVASGDAVAKASKRIMDDHKELLQDLAKGPDR